MADGSANGHNGGGGVGHNGNGNGQNDSSENGTSGKNTSPKDTSQKQTGQNTRNGTAVALKCTCKFPKVYTDGQEIGTIKKIIKTETLQMKDGSRYSRRHVCEPQTPNEWREVIPPVMPKTPPKHKSLWVVRQTQISKNPHWSLFAAFDNDNDGTKGRIWQVNGDPDVGMHYAHCSSVPGVAVFISTSFLDSLLVCKRFTESMEARVDEIANTVKPPGPGSSPPNKDQGRKIDFHRGTCRTWVWDILDRLVEEGITTSDVATKARKLHTKPVE